MTKRRYGLLQKIEAQHGRADRMWVMDRGIPTEEILQEMRSAEQPIHYLVGTPKGRLSEMENAFFSRPWEQVREGVDVKLLENDGEVYVLAKSTGRVDKERSMRLMSAIWYCHAKRNPTKTSRYCCHS